ncbi:MAG: hypothetical protein C3F11_16515 [Methylocystaceae bacterium]|nr:MAG: hypothetical protein C3F11_16515 [Methylocystaceae bacterium]
MSEIVATDFSEPQPAAQPHDLLARLYREIGISAVAAALDVMADPAPSRKAEGFDESPLPAILCENVAA